jgi:hypothetical protein
MPPIQVGMSMKNKSTLAYPQFGLRLVAIGFLFLNLRTILLCTLTTKTVFLQTAKNSSHQLQELQTTCQAQTSPNIRSHKITEGELNDLIRDLKLPKRRQNFWH